MFLDERPAGSEGRIASPVQRCRLKRASHVFGKSMYPYGTISCMTALGGTYGYTQVQLCTNIKTHVNLMKSLCKRVCVYVCICPHVYTYTSSGLPADPPDRHPHRGPFMRLVRN